MFSYRKPRKHFGGGVAVLYKSHLKVDKVTSKSHYKSFEHIECLIRSQTEVYRFANIYRKEYSTKHKVTANEFMEEFAGYLDLIITKPGIPMIVGDFNFHVEKPDEDKEALEFLKTLDSYHLSQLVDGPTHELLGTLDLLITLDKKPVKELKVLDNRLKSDHHPIAFRIDCIPLHKDSKIDIVTRNWKVLDVTKFKDEVRQSEIYSPDPNLSLEDAINLYNTTLKSILDEHCPIQHKTVRPRPLQKWYNDELRHLKRKKRAAEKKWKKLNTSSNKLEYDEVNKQYKDAIKLARCMYYRTSLSKDKHDVKRIFKTINKLTGDDFTSMMPTHSNKKVLADNMTNFFASKIESIREEIKIYNEENDLLSNVSDATAECPNALLSHFSTVSKEDLKELLSSMNNKVNPSDPIPIWLVKECFDEISPILTAIINKSLEQAQFPQALKHATIRPMIKDTDEDPDVLKNYRPISNTPFVAKLLEKAALRQLNIHIEENNLHNQFQSGYKKNHSCETAIFKITNDIMQFASEKKVIPLILLDLSAAFDTVDHNILIERLHNDFGISGRVLQWLLSYLSDRTFSVIIGNQEADKKTLLYGVPQGSILGPLLFILYTNDLSKIALKYGLFIHIYADDTQLYIGFRPLSEYSDTIKRITLCLEEIKIWMFSNFLKLNVNKTKVLLIGSPTNTHFYRKININYDGVPIDNPPEGYVKTLGVLLDKNLSMEQQVNQICKACYFHLRNLGRIRHYLDIDLKILLVKSYVLSKIDYCNIILANINAALLKKLERVQNASIRFIYNLKKNVHISQYLKLAHFLPVKHRIEYKLCFMAFKILNGCAPDYLNDMITLQAPQHQNLRRNFDRYRLEIPKNYKTISHKMSILWNNLPYSLRCCTELKKFKKDLKTYFFNIAY